MASEEQPACDLREGTAWRTIEHQIITFRSETEGKEYMKIQQASSCLFVLGDAEAMMCREQAEEIQGKAWHIIF